MGDTDAVKKDAVKPQPQGPQAPPSSPQGQPQTQPAITDTTAEFEEYTAPPRLDEKGRPVQKAKGLKAAGYQFPPPGGPTPPLTKANLAKGIGVPEIPRPAPSSSPKPEWPAPPLAATKPASPGLPPASPPVTGPTAAPPAKPSTVKVDEGELFEEYQRSDLKDRPRTGKGIRSEPPPGPGEPDGPRAKDILAKLPEPDLQVFTPKRFSPYQVKAGEQTNSPGSQHPEHEKAALDAAADLAVHRKWLESATMSNPTAGPIKAVVDHGDDEPEAVVISQPALSPPPSHPVPISPEPSMDTTLPHDAELAPSAPTTMSAAPTIEPARPTTAPYVPPPPAVITAPTPRPVAPAPPAPASTSRPGVHSSGAPPAPSGGDVPRIALVQADFNYDVTTRMAQAAHEKARMLGAPIVHHVHVPGAFDIPLTAQALLERDDVDAVVCLGAIVQGETGHDTLIARECARLLADLALRARKPVGFGVTGPGMTRDQAWARIGAGANAVESAVKQHRVLKQVGA